MNKTTGMVVVSESALPEVIIKVLHAKELKAASQQMSSSEACRIVGISRSAYYKYKDSVFRYEEQSQENIFSLGLLLKDRQGVLSAVIAKLYEQGLYGIIELGNDNGKTREPFTVEKIAEVCTKGLRIIQDNLRWLFWALMTNLQ